ncbi:MAG: T9SS type A sorting domain-containing protein [Flavobacteriales bacterium]
MLYVSDTFYVKSLCINDTKLIQLPNQTSTFNGNTRGYYFVAPVDFIITGLRVPTDASALNQNIEVLRFNSSIPQYANSTNDFSSLAYFNNVPGTGIINTYIEVFTGDIIGILGVRGNVNSYASGPSTISIDGNSVTIERLGFQGQLASVQGYDLWAELNGSISRVEMYYSSISKSDSTLAIAQINQSVGPINISESICQGDSILLGGAFQTSAGTYTYVFQSTAGCDSTVITQLNITPLPLNTTTINNLTITSDISGATYQWIDCNTGLAIPNETNQSFTASTNGSYAVQISQNGCDDLSECVIISTVGIDEYNTLFSVYPNPASNEFTVSSSKEGVYNLVNSLGQVVKTIEIKRNNNFTITVSDLSSGVYYLVGGLNPGQSHKIIIMN